MVTPHVPIDLCVFLSLFQMPAFTSNLSHSHRPKSVLASKALDKQTVETKAKKNKQKNKQKKITSIPESFGHLLQTNNSYIIRKKPNKQQGGKKSNHM